MARRKGFTSSNFYHKFRQMVDWFDDDSVYIERWVTRGRKYVYTSGTRSGCVEYNGLERVADHRTIEGQYAAPVMAWSKEA